MSSDDKRKKIVQRTAELLYSIEGGTELTTRKIAENAGINPAMVNYYFGSKDGLLKAAISVINGNDPSEASHDEEGSRKAMFNLLIRVCEESIQCARYGLGKDTALISKDALDTSSRLIEMKRLYGGSTPDEEDAVSIFRAVSFLMTVSSDPEGFAVYSGIDIRVKGQLRLLVSKQLDILLGDAL